MKTKTTTIASIIAAATTLAAGISAAAERTLILLQENSSGTSYLSEYETDTTFADNAIDFTAELSQSIGFGRRALFHYGNRFINLTDRNCTRSNLLNALISETKAGRTIDLAILGHGSDNSLRLFAGETLTGQTFTFNTVTSSDGTRRVVRQENPGTIRALLTEARQRERNNNFNFNLRLVHMCNCFGATLNDDWRAVGAKTSVGAPGINWMPVPMIDVFWDKFLSDDLTVQEAMELSLSESRRLWRNVAGYNIVDPEKGVNKLNETQQRVAGVTNLIFNDQFQLRVGSSKTVTVKGADIHNFADLFIARGDRYSMSATGTWSSALFAPQVNANGHRPGPNDRSRRFSGANMMTLCGETFDRNRNILTNVSNSKFRIGTGIESTPNRRGFLSMFANDTLPLGYVDNSGSVRVTIRRTR